MVGDLIPALPEANRQSCEIGGAQCGRLDNLGTDDGGADQVLLELHQEIVARSAAVHAQLGQPHARIRLHGIEQIR